MPYPHIVSLTMFPPNNFCLLTWINYNTICHDSHEFNRLFSVFFFAFVFFAFEHVEHVGLPPLSHSLRSGGFSLEPSVSTIPNQNIFRLSSIQSMRTYTAAFLFHSLLSPGSWGALCMISLFAYQIGSQIYQGMSQNNSSLT